MDPGVIVCDRTGDLAPGETLSYAFAWKFPEEGSGDEVPGARRALLGQSA
jgi:hypothetical protein